MRGTRGSSWFAAGLLLAAAGARADEVGEALVDLRISALVAVLEGGGAGARDGAAVALAGLGEAGVPALLRGLESGTLDDRLRCGWALADVEPPPAAAVAPLVALLEAARDEGERHHIGMVLALFAGASPAHDTLYLEAAAGNRALTRRHGLLGVSRLGPDDRTIPVVLAALGDDDPWLRALAVVIVAHKDWWAFRDRWNRPSRHDPATWEALWSEPAFAQHRPAVLKALVPLVARGASETRALAANALGRAETRLPEGALDALRAALQDEDNIVVWRAALSLGGLVERGLAPREVLLSMLRMQDHNAQRTAAETILHMGGNVAWARPALEEAWSSPASLQAKEAVAAALGRIGAATPGMVGQLAAAYADEDPWDRNIYTLEGRETVAERLRGANDAYTVLLAAARGERKVEVNYWYRGLKREDAVRALEAFPDRKDETLPVLKELLEEGPTWNVRYRAAEVLQRFGAPPEVYLERLGSLIDHAYSYWLVISAQLYLRAAPGSHRPVPRLLRALEEKSPVTGGQPYEMAQVLASVGRLPASARDPLLRAAREGDVRLRAEALRALGCIEGADPLVRRALWDALKDSRFADEAADGLARCITSPADVARLLKEARGEYRRDFLWTFAKRPEVAGVAEQALAAMARKGDDLPWVMHALDAIAPESATAREAHLKLLASDAEHANVWRIENGVRGDAAFVPPLIRRLLHGRMRWDGGHELFSLKALLAVAAPEDLPRIAEALGGILDLPQTQREALQLLGEMGPRAAAALPAVRKLEGNRDRDLGELARATRERLAR